MTSDFADFDLDLDDDDDEEEEEVTAPYPAYEDVEVDVWAVLGQAEVRVSNLLKIGRGALIDLEREISDHIEIYSNGQRIATAEIVIIEDKLGFRITKVFSRNLLFNAFPLMNKSRDQKNENP